METQEVLPCGPREFPASEEAGYDTAGYGTAAGHGPSSCFALTYWLRLRPAFSSSRAHCDIL
jgi:hypothetical protein